MLSLRSRYPRLLVLSVARLFRFRIVLKISLLSFVCLVLVSFSKNSIYHSGVNRRSEGSNETRETNPLPPKLQSDLNLSLVENLVQIYLTRRNQPQDPYRLRSEESYLQFLRRLASIRIEGYKVVKVTNSTPSGTSLEAFYRGISQHYMYDPFSQDLSRLLSDLSSLPIASAVKVEVGTQLKIILTLSDGSQGRFKLMRRPKGEAANPNAYQFHDYERHTAEIAAFHLDRTLGFYRTAPTVGRVLNITRDLADFTANKSWVDYVYRSPAGNVCFVAQCHSLCGVDYPYCGSDELVEGAFSALLPPDQRRGRHSYYENPFKFPYWYSGKPVWITRKDVCEKDLRNSTRFRGTRAMLDVIDSVIFDFLTGNMDRHHVEWFTYSGNNSFLFHLDNGRGFGTLNNVGNQALIPLRQCCLIRLSTLAKLLKINLGPLKLSDIMRTSLNSDLLSPVLSEDHLVALDMKLAKVLETLGSCLTDLGKSWEDMVLDDKVI